MAPFTLGEAARIILPRGVQSLREGAIPQAGAETSGEKTETSVPLEDHKDREDLRGREPQTQVDQS